MTGAIPADERWQSQVAQDKQEVCWLLCVGIHSCALLHIGILNARRKTKPCETTIVSRLLFTEHL